MAITSEQDTHQPLIVPDIEVANSGGDDVSTSTTYAEDHVKSVTIGAGLKQVQLPNGFAYDGGEEVELTQWEFDQISQAAFDAGVVTDTTA